MVRLITAIDLPAKITKTDGKYTIDPPVANVTKVKSVIFYAHGGGFLSMSSFNHQNYTRIFANETKIPVISCDYRLTKADSNAFPTSLNDCFQAYYWVVTQGLKQLGLECENVIVSGDSAGGNLSLGITMLACLFKKGIDEGLYKHLDQEDLARFKVPNNALYNYPFVKADNDNFFPSDIF